MAWQSESEGPSVEPCGTPLIPFATPWSESLNFLKAGWEAQVISRKETLAGGANAEGKT